MMRFVLGLVNVRGLDLFPKKTSQILFAALRVSVREVFRSHSSVLDSVERSKVSIIDLELPSLDKVSLRIQCVGVSRMYKVTAKLI